MKKFRTSRWLGAIALIFALIAATLALSSPAGATVSLDGDINVLSDIDGSAGDSGAATGVMLGTDMLFAADDGTNGNELWITDGTTAGTEMLKDINPIGSSNPTEMTVLGSLVLFSANNGADSSELWATDGTPGGTVLIKDIHSLSASFPSRITTFGSSAVFRAVNDTEGTELWITDGTADGTNLVTDIAAGALSSTPQYMTPLGDPATATQVVFSAEDATNGTELWITDGTAVGTTLVADLQAGAASSDPILLTPFGDEILFVANDGSTGAEMWKTDGTPGGTQIVANINLAGSSQPRDITTFGSVALFRATDGVNGLEVWSTDGTPGGTGMLANINPAISADGNPAGFTVLGDPAADGVVLFTADNGTNGIELWSSDGTPGGTAILKDINPAGDSSPMDLTTVGASVFFFADDGETGSEPWVTDGTANGTMRLDDVAEGSADSRPALPAPIVSDDEFAPTFVEVDDSLLFAANDGATGIELYALGMAPSAPTGVTATALEDEQSTVSFTASAMPGPTPPTYTVTADPGGATCVTATTSCVVTGLTAQERYSFTVTGGGGDASAPSNVVLVGPLAIELEAGNPCFGLEPTHVGTDGDDEIYATNGPDIILTYGGDDLVYARQGDDTVCTGDGDDRVFGGSGANLIYGEAGIDKLRAGADSDAIHGGDDRDFLKGGHGDDEVWGDGGSDRIRGSLGNDVVHGGDDDDVLWGGPGNDTLFGDAGNDILKGSAGINTCDGGEGIDTTKPECQTILNVP